MSTQRNCRFEGELAPNLTSAAGGLEGFDSQEPGQQSLVGTRSPPASPCQSTRAAGPTRAPGSRGATAARGRFDPRSGPRRPRDLRLGAARGGKGRDRRRAGAGAGLRDRPQRRPRGSPRRPRTTLDVLNAQQELLSARVNLITAQRDRVVGSYAVVQAAGRLNSRALALKVDEITARRSISTRSRTFRSAPRDRTGADEFRAWPPRPRWLACFGAPSVNYP